MGPMFFPDPLIPRSSSRARPASMTLSSLSPAHSGIFWWRRWGECLSVSRILWKGFLLGSPTYLWKYPVVSEFQRREEVSAVIYPHFINEDKEAQRSWITYWGTHSHLVAVWLQGKCSHSPHGADLGAWSGASTLCLERETTALTDTTTWW